MVNDIAPLSSGYGSIIINDDIFSYELKSEHIDYDKDALESDLSVVKSEFFKFMKKDETSFKPCIQNRKIDFYVSSFSKINRRWLWPSWMSKIPKKDNVFGIYDVDIGKDKHDVIVFMRFNAYDLDIALIGHEMAHFMYNTYCLTSYAEDTETFAKSFEMYLKEKY